MSDESLDSLFKKGLSERNVAFNMESWRKMEQMLPAEPKPTGYKYGITAAVVGALFVLTASILVWSNLDELSSDPNTPIAELSDVHENDVTSENNEKENMVKKQESPELSNAITANANKPAENKQAEKETKNVNNVSHTIMPSNVTAKNVAFKKKTQTNTNAFFAQNDGFNSLRVNSEEAISSHELGHETVFTTIDGLDELATNVLDEEEHTLFAEMGNAKLLNVEKNEFGFIGGISINPSLVQTGSSSISGCEFLGITYQRYLKGGLSLKADLLYAPRTEINSVKYYDQKTYGFGSIKEQTKVESQRLVFIELPVMLNYNMGNHNLMGGASMSYLVTGLHKVSTEYTSQTESSVEDKMEWGYTNGFNNVDFSLVAGYEYSIKSRWNIGMRVNYGLLDVTNNDYFQNDSFDNNMQLRVYLKYSPFRF